MSFLNHTTCSSKPQQDSQSSPWWQSSNRPCLSLVQCGSHCLCDSHFASAVTTQEFSRLGMLFIGVVKTATKHHPMEWLNSQPMANRGDALGLLKSVVIKKRHTVNQSINQSISASAIRDVLRNPSNSHYQQSLSSVICHFGMRSKEDGSKSSSASTNDRTRARHDA